MLSQQSKKNIGVYNGFKVLHQVVYCFKSMPSETKSVPPSLSRHRHAWQHRKDLFALWTISGSDPCPTPTHTLELGLSTHGGRTRSGMEPSIATSVDDTPCLNIYAPLYMVLNFLGPSILIVQICFVCKGEDYKAMEYRGAVLSKIQG